MQTNKMKMFLSRSKYVILISLLIIVFIYNHFIYNPQPAPYPILTQLNDLQKQSLITISELTKLLISLSTGLYAVIGIFVLQYYKADKILSTKLRDDTILAFTFAALSIDFGYIFMEKWVELLANGIFAPFDRIVTIPQTLQLVTFLLALFFTGRLVLKELINKS